MPAVRSVSAVAILAGPMVLSGYIVGSVIALRLRRQPREQPAPSDMILEAFATLAVSTAAWWAIKEVSPGSSFSRIGYFSNQVLSAWQSVALWAGLAVITGLCASAFRRFDGSNGLAPLAAMLAVHFPWFLFGAAAAAAVGFATGRSVRIAEAAGIGSLLPLAYLGWVLEWQPAWGLPAGPEATVWCMVVTIVVGSRWWHDRELQTV